MVPRVLCAPRWVSIVLTSASMSAGFVWTRSRSGPFRQSLTRTQCRCAILVAATCSCRSVGSGKRFEFALLRNEKTEDIASEEAAWRLLEQYHGLGRDDLQLIRHLVYTFECRLAKRWRVGNVFLAGDAAHTNPPYLGQGACSGMRDAANLAWKLDLVLRGVSGDALLDTYEAERRPHVLTLMQQARSLGLVANTVNPIKAAVRDLLFRFKLAPKPEFPTLNDGMLQRQHDGKLAPRCRFIAGAGAPGG
jgi:3-(3-hydroxy-phenyl)propionate hydroxylase